MVIILVNSHHSLDKTYLMDPSVQPTSHPNHMTALQFALPSPTSSTATPANTTTTNLNHRANIIRRHQDDSSDGEQLEK